MHAEHADASVRLQDRRSRIRYRRTCVAGIESQAESRPCPHPRVLRASPSCICAESLALLCRGPMLAHPLPGPRRRTRFWRYTLALRVYGASVVLPVLLTFEITAARDEFPATCGEGVRRVTVAPQHRKEFSADAERRCTRHADASVRLQDRRSRIRYRRTRVAGIESQAEPRPCPHPRVLRASPSCICAEILALRCRGPMLAHPLPGPRRRTRFWPYTLALRVYGAPFWLWPTAALRLDPCLLADQLGRCAIWTGIRRSVLLRRGVPLGTFDTRRVRSGVAGAKLLSGGGYVGQAADVCSTADGTERFRCRIGEDADHIGTTLDRCRIAPPRPTSLPRHPFNSPKA